MALSNHPIDIETIFLNGSEYHESVDKHSPSMSGISEVHTVLHV